MAGLIPFNKRSNNSLSFGNDIFYNMLDDFFSNDFFSFKNRNLSTDTFKIDVEENESDYTICAELPGINKEEINLSFNDGRLIISIDKNEEVNEENRNFIHKERRHSSMSRSIYLSDGIADGISAKHDNGILTIIVPKQKQAINSHKIAIE